MDTAAPALKPKVLCVDDEPHVIAGLALHLRRRYEAVQATSGAAGLEALRKHPDIAIVISDMRMPNMDGAAFLSLARTQAPDAVRVLLTGQADIESAVAAINQGQIFRFLTKPCPPPSLMAAMDAAHEQHRLLTTERVLLDQTLRGSVKAVTDVLALTSPLAFGCAMRVKQHVVDLAAQLNWLYSWQVDVAAMLCQLGSVSLPAGTAEKLYYGSDLNDDEREMVARMPDVTKQLLASIPRLEIVLDILSRTNQPHATDGKSNSVTAGEDAELVRRGAELLKAAIDFDAHDTKGFGAHRAITLMRKRHGHYDPLVLDAVEALHGNDQRETEVDEVPITALVAGMVLADEMRTTDGMLLSARGLPVTAGLVERIRNDRRSLANQRVRVLIRRAAAKREAS
jgi:CheY-like chemotaxis protein